MLNSIRERTRGEAGLVLPAAIGMLLGASLLIGAGATAAVRASHGASRDQAVKLALDAAESGLRIAAYRLNKTQPANDKCVVAQLNADGTTGALSPAGDKLATDSDPSRDWCPSQPVLADGVTPTVESDGNGGSFSYQMTTATTLAEGGPLRTVVATGVVGCTVAGGPCVKRRLEAQYDAGGKIDYAVYGKNSVTINNSADVTELVDASPASANCPVPGPIAVDATKPYTSDGFCGARIGTEGDLSIGGTSPRVCGMARMAPNPGRLYRHTGNTPSNAPPAPARCLPNAGALGIPASGSATEPTAQAPANHFVGSADDNMPIVERDATLRRPPQVQLPATSNNASIRVPTATQPASGDRWNAGGGQSVWDQKRLIIDNSTGTTLTLTGSTYVFCYLRIDRGALWIQPQDLTKPTKIFIAAPGSTLPSGEVCPTNSGPPPDATTGAKWGQVTLSGQAKIYNTTNNPGRFILQVQGDSSTDDDVTFGSNFSWQAVPVYAPNSKIDVSNDTGLSSAIGESVVIGSGKGVHWDDRVLDVLPGARQNVYYRTDWNECSALPVSAGDPASGC